MMGILKWYRKVMLHLEIQRCRYVVDNTVKDCRIMGVKTNRKRICRLLGANMVALFPEEDAAFRWREPLTEDQLPIKRYERCRMKTITGSSAVR